MYNTPFPFIPDSNLGNINFTQQLVELDKRISRLERNNKRLEHRIYVLEKNKPPYVSTNQKNQFPDDDGMYMV